MGGKAAGSSPAVAPNSMQRAAAPSARVPPKPLQRSAFVPSKTDREFQEIAHCGGKVTITIKLDERGHVLASVGMRNSRSAPAALFIVLADSSGQPFATPVLGGLASPAPGPPPKAEGCSVFISSDNEGYFGHQCPRCEGYWRSTSAPSRWPLTCPYCALRAETHHFLTDAQLRYVESYCELFYEAVRSGIAGETTIDMDSIADAIAEEKRPDFYYAEQRQQKQFICLACRGDNDILGRYGYCSTCGTHNGVQELGLDLAAAQVRIATASYEGALNDSVSAFDSFAKQLAKQLAARIPLRRKRKTALEKALFHSLGPRAKELLDWFDINIFEGLSEAEVVFIKR